MMTKRMCTGLATAALAAFVLAAQKPDAAETLLQTAIKKEVVDGNLQSALDGYKKALAAAKGNRAVAANAMVHMAGCYRKMGDAQAQKVYEAIVRDYADQKEAAAVASAHLSRNGDPRGTSASFRHLWTLPPGRRIRGFERVSPDGRYFPYGGPDLYVHDLITGVDRRLTNEGTAGGPGVRMQEADGETAFSPDSKQLAYTWGKENASPISGIRVAYEIRVVDLRGSGIPQYRRLFGSDDIDWLTPSAWSPDGKWIVAQLSRIDDTRLALISTLDGTMRLLRKMEWRGRFITTAAFTPDGKWIAFDARASQDARQNDIFVIAADGSSEIRAVKHPADDYLAGWSPDGKRLLFTSDRTGRKDLWSLPFWDGKVQGEPEMIKAGVDLQSSFGITDSGSIYSVVSPQTPTEIKVATVDLDTGSLVSPPVSIVAGNNRDAEWSPDGKYVAYASASEGSVVIGIQTAETGQTREIRPKLVRIGAPHWSPDGRSLIVLGRDLNHHWGLDRIDVQTGTLSRVLDGFGNTDPSWSSDGKSIYYRKNLPDTKEAAFVELDLASGKQREIVRQRSLGGINLSPDGRFIATKSIDVPSKIGRILLVPVQGGEVREVQRLPLEQIGSVFGWARDGRTIYVLKTPTDRKQPRELIRVGIDGVIIGKAVRLDPTAEWVSVHPDGRRVVFHTASSVNGSGSRQEVWVLENVLPRDPKKK